MSCCRNASFSVFYKGLHVNLPLLTSALVQTIEFPDDELVEPLEGLDIADDGVELPPPPPPTSEPEPVAPVELTKPNLLVSRGNKVEKWAVLVLFCGACFVCVRLC